MPTTEEQAAALAQQVTADYIDGLQAQLDAARAVPQGGYGTLPPAIPASGAQYSAPGAYEGYADYGFPPVMYQRSPYATAAYRTYMSPFGQLGVQPLIGFPSAYPHVIQYPGDNPFRAMGLLDALAGTMWPHWPMAMPQMPRMRVGGGGGAPRNTAASANTAPQTLPAQAEAPIPPMRLVPPEVRYAEGAPAPNVAVQQTAVASDHPWNYYSTTGESLPPRMGMPNIASDVWDWLSGAGKPTPDELNAEYNAALQQQSPAVQRATQDFIQQQSIPLTELAGPLDVMHAAQQVPQRLQLPPVTPSLYDVVNTPSGAVLQAAGYR